MVYLVCQHAIKMVVMWYDRVVSLLCLELALVFLEEERVM